MTTTYASDTFTRTDQNPLGTSDGPGALVWSSTAQLGTFQIFSNLAFTLAFTADAHNSATLNAAQNDVSVSADITLTNTANRTYRGLRIRQTDSNNWMVVNLVRQGGSDLIQVDEVAGGVYLGPLATNASAGITEGGTYNLKVVVAASTVAVYLDGVLKISPVTFTSASLTGQDYGINAFRGATADDGNGWWDNFLVTDNPAVSAQPPPRRIVM